MANTPPQLKVFLCHASEDKPIVRDLYDRLRMDGFDPWLDSELLVPGENWPLEIQKAMRASQAVIVCLSEVAIVKEGYIHTEIKTAQSLQMEKPEGTIFFIPLQLEKCDLPFSMRDIQWGKYFEPDGYEKLVKALNKRAEQVKVAQGVIKSKKRPHPASPALAPGASVGTPLPKSGEGTGVRDSVRGGDNSVVIGKDANQAVIVPGSGNTINIYGAAAATQPPEAKTEPSQGGLPPGSHLPFSRNALFTGREKDLEKLAAALTSLPPTPKDRGGSVVITQAITGMGGIGKTQLAVEFAYRYGDQFKGVHWLDLRDPAALNEQIAACGEKMALQPWSEKLPEQVALTLRAWQTDGSRLLILDNFESVKDASQVLARFQSPSLRLLITSRHSDWPSTLGLQPVPLDTFTPAESRKFLKKYLKNRSTNEELDQLAERLGHLPLALELAGRYFDGHPRLSVPQYLTRLEQAFEHASMRGFRADLPNPTRHDLDLFATFTLSWEQVKSEPTQKIFLAAGYCAANTAIPPEIFEKTVELDETACDECIQSLVGLGLLGEEITIHPLLAEFARRLDTEHAILKKLAGVLVEISFTALTTELVSSFLPLRHHVNVVAIHLLDISPQFAGALWIHYGNHLRDYGDYQKNETVLLQAVTLCKIHFGVDHPITATALSSLGVIYFETDRYELAKKQFEHALKIDVSVNGYNNQATARDLSNLGQVLRALGSLDDAKECLLKALKIDESLFGTNHIEFAKNLNNLAFVYLDENDLPKSKAMLEKSIQIYKKNNLENHPNVGMLLHNLSGISKDLGDLTKAKILAEQALTILEQELPSDHPKIQQVKYNLNWLNENISP